MARALIYAPADRESVEVNAFGHTFKVGVYVDLGEDEAAYNKLKNNPEFSASGERKQSISSPPEQAASEPDPAADESNEGRDATTRAAVQKRAILSLKPQPRNETA